MIDTKKRGLAKAISWRVVASMVLGTLTWLLTGSLQTVGAMLVLFNIIQVCTYFFHERIWGKISWGKTKGLFIQMSGWSGAGKTTISQAVAKKLRKNGYKVELIDGDEYRTHISKGLGFSKEGRLENIRRLGFIGRVLARNNVIAIMAAINPYDEARMELEAAGAKTVFVRCSLETLKERDPKGLYRRALLPPDHPDRIDNFTGISDPFEDPAGPALVLQTDKETLTESVDKMYKFIVDNV